MDADTNGKVELHEFKLFVKRIGIDLTEHKIIEIFTSVKMAPVNIHEELMLTK